MEGTGRDPAEIVAAAEHRGVRIVWFGRTVVRATTHLDVTRDDVVRAAEILAELLAGSAARAEGDG